ncbi:MAG: PKD domain-containing protein [Nanoarchaeota archaeon]|nr:PKD domain-containing protein [Nanoarchaeota archaeon]MBU1644007.1 PKD domain-containing protein [Nanoarchaeota archaeon]MBU1976443.1 PKD domain-containing protein [Nanoarchaeota archaeon]
MIQHKTRLLLGLLVLILAVSSSVLAVKTFQVQETDLVKINAKAVDPDKDEVTYRYSSPLNENGTWQTGYDDAGEYPLKITASDGLQETDEEILLVVKNKNQPPYLTEKKITVKETQTVDLKTLVTDPDDDLLSYEFNDPFDNSGIWKTGYDGAGIYLINFKVNDGSVETKLRIEVEVLQTNQPPEIIDSFSEAKIIPLREGQDLKFKVEAQDNDQDQLTYLWKIDETVVGEEEKGEYYLDYDSSGEHLLTVSVSDGIVAVVKEWTLNVENVNRKPTLELLPLKINEGEIARLDLPDVDLDSDELSYSFDDKFDEEGFWQTTYDDAGVYSLNIYASDGEFTVKEKVRVTVTDVDRAPTLNLPESLSVKEGEVLEWSLDTEDLDGDNVIVIFENAPEGAMYDQELKKFSLEPDYSYLARKRGIISDLLNTFRLENKILNKKIVTVKVKSCGKDLCSVGSVPLTIYNTDRAPVIEALENITVQETEKVRLEPKTSDPDGDLVKLSYSWPLSKSGTWQTGYGDRDTYTIYVTASDGTLSETVPVNVKVEKNNRQPSLHINNDKIVVNEGHEFGFMVTAADPDDKELDLSLDHLPEGASFKEGLFIWKASSKLVTKTKTSWLEKFVSGDNLLNKWFNSNKEEVWLEFKVSDGEFEVVHPVKITVKDVNQAPKVLDYLPAGNVKANLNEAVVFHVAAKDDDQDELSYKWSFSGFGEDPIVGTDTIERTFTTPGNKKVKVVISDGVDEVEKEWSVSVSKENGEAGVTSDGTTSAGKYSVYVIKY